MRAHEFVFCLFVFFIDRLFLCFYQRRVETDEASESYEEMLRQRVKSRFQMTRLM